MCDYCGCRRHAPIEELSEEHEELLEIGYRLRRLAREGAPAEALELLEERLVPLLRAHTAKEERGLFAQLRSTWAADDRLDALISEHRAMDAALATVCRGGPRWTAALEVLLADLAEHILAEETDLFPYAAYDLDADQWRAVEEVHSEGVGERSDRDGSRTYVTVTS